MKKIIPFIFTILLFACQRNDTPINNPDPNETAILYLTGIINEYVLANEIFQGVVNNVGDALLFAEGALAGKNNTKDGPLISIEPFDFDSFPKTITVDFGSGTLCEDGFTRRGKIIIVSNAWFGQMGSIQTINFSNYYHDIFRVDGIQVVENLGVNPDGYLVFRETVEDGLVTSDNGIRVTFIEEAIRTWIVGAETSSYIWDDEYLLEAYQFGMSTDGTEYSLVFEEPLHYDLLPRAIKSGIIDLEIGGVSGIQINYTNKAITVLGKTIPWD